LILRSSLAADLDLADLALDGARSSIAIEHGSAKPSSALEPVDDEPSGHPRSS
jgi:hypothetical protein